MSAEQSRGDFDANPPMPVSEYERTVSSINVGYEFVFTLTTCILEALCPPDLKLLVVGAGGGAEVEQFLPQNPGWHLTGVDPSGDMLALAQAKAEYCGVATRTTLTRGGVDSLPSQEKFGAATCIFVLHFLPDEGKLALLREIRTRLQGDGPLLVVTGARPDDGFNDDLLNVWQRYAEMRGMAPERVSAIISQLVTQPMTEQEKYVQLLTEAGFPRITKYFSVLGGAISAWLAR